MDVLRLFSIIKVAIHLLSSLITVIGLSVHDNRCTSVSDAVHVIVRLSFFSGILSFTNAMFHVLLVSNSLNVIFVEFVT